MLLPDRTLVLTLPKGEAESRAAARDGSNVDRFGAKNTEYHQKVMRSFENFSKAEPLRFHMIDASGEAPDVTARLITAIEDLL
jgi:dTMP kinase